MCHWRAPIIRGNGALRRASFADRSDLAVALDEPMRERNFQMSITRIALAAFFGSGLVCAAATAHAAAADCPNGGTVRFGIEPYEAGATLVPIFEKVGALIEKQLDCKV